MGVINITPDSFSDGGRFTKVEAAVQEAKRQLRQGADVLDLGAHPLLLHREGNIFSFAAAPSCVKNN